MHPTIINHTKSSDIYFLIYFLQILRKLHYMDDNKSLKTTLCPNRKQIKTPISEQLDVWVVCFLLPDL